MKTEEFLLKMAIQYGMLYFETSAKNADVEKIFIHLVKALPQILPGTPISPEFTVSKDRGDFLSLKILY